MRPTPYSLNPTDKNTIESKKKEEEFVEQLINHLQKHPLSQKDVNVFLGVIRRARNIYRIDALNIRYIFSTHPEYKYVPQNVELLIDFLKDKLFLKNGVDWNPVFKALYCISCGEDLDF